MKKVVKLKVAEAIQDDVNKGVIRIDSTYMHELDVRPEDIVEIKGERTTLGVIDRAYPGDIGLNIIRMDGLVRRNAKSGISEFVEVSKADIKEAKSVIVSPIHKEVRIEASPKLFKHALVGRAVLPGDVVSLGGSRRKKSTPGLSKAFFDDVFDMDSVLGFGLSDLKFVVSDTTPKQAVMITENTEIVYNPEPQQIKDSKALEVSYEDIGGLRDELTKVREMVELPLKHPEIFERLGIDPPKGVLLHGPPGTGKTLLAKAVANETHANFISINGPEIMSKYYGQSEQNLRKKFEEAEKNAPSIIFIDEIDALAIKREESHGEVERRVVAQLLTLMDGLKSRGKVVVMAASNIPNSLDPAIRRPGRFDREIEIGVPDKLGRENILKIHTRNMPIDVSLAQIGISNLSKKDLLEQLLVEIARIDIIELSNILHSNSKSDKLFVISRLKESILNSLKSSSIESTIKDFISLKIATEVYSSIRKYENRDIILNDIRKVVANIKSANKLSDIIDNTVKEIILSNISDNTYGFVGADLYALCKEAAMNVLRRLLPDLKTDLDSIPSEVLEKLRITAIDFRESLKVVQPSAMREVLVEIPSVTWNDIGGLEDIRQELVEAVEWPLNHPEAYTRMGVRPPRGILIYGPPGTGKTLLAKAVAKESKANFISVKGPELLSKWVNETPQLVKKLFSKARQVSPCVVFIDEIDSIAGNRDANEDSGKGMSAINQLLTEMDGLEALNDVIVIAATNRPDIIDPALMRPGRFDRIILASVPTSEARRDILKIHTSGMPLALEPSMEHNISPEDVISLDKLAVQTEGFVGADIDLLCREAAILALRENMDCTHVLNSHFDAALEKVKPSVTQEVVEVYKSFKDKFREVSKKSVSKTDTVNYFG